MIFNMMICTASVPPVQYLVPHYSPFTVTVVHCQGLL